MAEFIRGIRMEHTAVTFSSYCCLGFFCLISGSTMQDCVAHIFLMIDMVLLEKGILMMGRQLMTKKKLGGKLEIHPWRRI